MRRGKQVPDLDRQVGMTTNIFAERGSFAPAIALEELVGQPGHRVVH